MEIKGDHPLDPLSRRRQADAARGQKDGSSSVPAQEDATYSSADSAEVGRLVQILRNMSPADVQRIDQLKARIADGSYRADPEELADLLLGRGNDPTAH
ncbi:MAG: flagellar biosynthesis anti-sigma factor FlgM [Planctomycetota bacterium]